MNLRYLPDASLLQSTKDLAHKEREITLRVLHHLREVERRSLYATLSYSSLFEYCRVELRYSEGAAQRRIQSMRLLKSVPEIEEKVESGKLSLSALSQAQVFFKREGTNTKEKLEVLTSLENKSSREVEKELMTRSIEKGARPEDLIREKLRVVSGTHLELKVLIEENLLKEIEELKDLVAHTHPHATIKEILQFAVQQSLKQLRPKAPKAGVVTKLIPETKEVKKDFNKNNVEILLTPPAPAVQNRTRYIPREIKRQVWAIDKGECTYKDPGTGRKCSCKYGLELDHIIPFAVGGENTIENLRLRCRTHNQLAAVQSFGIKKIAQFVPRFR